MAQLHIWPVADDTGGGTPVGALVPIDLAGLASALGPEMTRLIGARCTVRSGPEAGHADASRPDMQVATLRLDKLPGDGMIAVLLPEQGVARLLDLLFGGTPGSPCTLPQLPPGSASWMALSGFLATAAGTAAAAIGHPPRGHVEQPRRAVRQADPAPQAVLLLDVEGEQIPIGLQLPLQPAPLRRHDAGWERRLAARTLDVDLPVGLRVAETRLPLAEVARLKAGDVIPFEQPESVSLLAAGEIVARWPAEKLMRRTDGQETTR